MKQKFRDKMKTKEVFDAEFKYIYIYIFVIKMEKHPFQNVMLLISDNFEANRHFSQVAKKCFKQTNKTCVTSEASELPI